MFGVVGVQASEAMFYTRQIRGQAERRKARAPARNAGGKNSADGSWMDIDVSQFSLTEPKGPKLGQSGKAGSIPALRAPVAAMNWVE